MKEGLTFEPHAQWASVRSQWRDRAGFSPASSFRNKKHANAMAWNRYVHEFVHDGRHLLGFPCLNPKAGCLWFELS